MASISEEEDVLEVAADAAARSYRETARNLGYQEGPVQSWVSAVMLRLQTEVKKRASLDETASVENLARRACAGRGRAEQQCP
jgi:DNA-directed RNA polymerase specialized sigma24 family protein